MPVQVQPPPSWVRSETGELDSHMVLNSNASDRRRADFCLQFYQIPHFAKLADVRVMYVVAAAACVEIAAD